MPDDQALWQLDTSGANWQAKTLEVPGIVWEKINNTVNAREATKGHAAVAYRKGQEQEVMVVIGGINRQGKYSQQISIYEAESRRWEHIEGEIKGEGN